MCPTISGTSSMGYPELKGRKMVVLVVIKKLTIKTF